MSLPLTPNTQAILLLTAPLIAGRAGPSAELLSPGEYNRLARSLRDQGLQPADLLASGASDAVGRCGGTVEAARLEELLGRGFLLSQAVERWQARAIWVVSRADPGYPRRMKSRLREDAPAVLYGCGDPEMLEAGGLAVVGSRHVEDTLIAYTESVGRLAAAADRMVISGGARGIDQAAMRGAAVAGGRAAAVLADSLERAALAREHREPLMSGRLVLVSPYDPAAGFNVGHAMQRNKCVYALADAALVVSSDYQKGGTWAGAVEQIEKWRLVPVYVRCGTDAGPGLDGLRRKGALPWPEPSSPEALAETIAPARAQGVQRQQSLLLAPDSGAGKVSESATDDALRARAAHCAPDDVAPKAASSPHSAPDAAAPPPATTDPASALVAYVAEVLRREIRAPMSDADIAALLGVSSAQARAWLRLLVEQGAVEKLTKPVRYCLPASARGLFTP